MNQIFKHSRSLWVKYSDYVINEAPNGKKYLQAAPKAVPQPCIWRVKYGEKLLIIWYNSNAMILYVDETENNEFFIVTGLLMSSRETTERVYRSFKKKARNMPVAKRDKAALFTEFKSTMLDRHYQRIKFKMIESLAETDKQIIYSCYVKKDGVFPQNFKEDTYIALLSRIVLHVEEDISIIFDAFNKSDFEERIVDRISTYNNVQAIMARDSQKEPGLQFVDNVCSILRLHKSDADKHGFYAQIEKWVREL